MKLGISKDTARQVWSLIDPFPIKETFELKKWKENPKFSKIVKFDFEML